MRMLDSLRNVVNDITNEGEQNFVQSLLTEEDEGRDFKESPLNPVQFNKLIKVQDKWGRPKELKRRNYEDKY